MKILIGPSTFGKLNDAPFVRLKNAGYEAVDNPYKRKLTKAELLSLLKKDIMGLIAGLEPLDREVLEESGLKVISRCGSGLSNVDLNAAKELNIRICSTPEAPVEAVAELTLGAMLCLLRMIPQMDSDLHAGKWEKRIGLQLEGKTVLIIGFGRIGRRLVKLMLPFNVKVLVVDPSIENNIEGATLVSLEEALPKADIITVHSSGKDCLLDKREFGIVKSGAFLLNAARGSLVSETALIKAIEENRIKGAWLDTFGEEPYSGSLTGYPQVILTPHVGSYTAECRKRMEIEAVDNLIEALKRQA